MGSKRWGHVTFAAVLLYGLLVLGSALPDPEDFDRA